MCRWLAYQGRAIHLEDLLYAPAHSLINQSLNARESVTGTNGDGFGIGWYGERAEPGIFREVLPAWNDSNLRSLAHQIKSANFFAHVRASTGTATSRANCHPFAYANWLFMHNGQIGAYTTIRRILENKIPDALFAHRLGTTDSELIFLLMLANGLQHDPTAAIHQTLADINQIMAANNIDEPFRFTATLSDGQQLIAVRYSSDPLPPTLYYTTNSDSVIFVSEPLDHADNEKWTAVPENTLLCYRNADINLAPLELS